MKKSFLGLVSALILTLSVLLAIPSPTIVEAATVAVVDTSTRATVQSSWNTNMAIAEPAMNWTGSTSTCTPGTISSTARDFALRRANWYRAMTGMQSVTENATYTTKAQASALIGAASGILDHTPPTTLQCYSANGNLGSQKSNLALGVYDISSAIDNWINDQGTNNTAVGHRRGILYPQSNNFGYGHTNNSASLFWMDNEDASPGATNFFSGARNISTAATSGSPIFNTVSYVAWPNRGYVPYMNVFNRWSIAAPSINFTGAVVKVTLSGVTCTPTIINRDTSTGLSAPENALVWDMSSCSGFPTYSFGVHSKPLSSATTSDYIYSVSVTGGIFGATGMTYPVKVFDPTSRPTGINISSTTLPENSVVGTTIGTLTQTGDVDPTTIDSWTYSLDASVTGAVDNGLVTISSDLLKVSSLINYEAPKTSLKVGVKVTDSYGSSFSKLLTINITNVNEAPTAIALTPSTTFYQSTSSYSVGTISSVDPDIGDTATYSLPVGQVNNSSFSITGNTLYTATNLPGGTYNVQIKATDSGGLTYIKTIPVSIAQMVFAPDSYYQGVREEQPVGEYVGVYNESTIPNLLPNKVYSLDSSIPGAVDNGLVAINQSGIVTTTQVLNFEAPKTSLKIGIKVTDSTGGISRELVTVPVININERPVDIVLSNATIIQGSPADRLVGNLSTVDPDTGDTHTYTLLNSSTSWLKIVGNQLLVRTVAPSVPTTENIFVTTTDAGGKSIQKEIFITILPAMAPTDINISSSTISENAFVGTNIGSLSQVGDIDPLDSWTYTLDPTVSGAIDNSLVTILGNQLKVGGAINFEAPKTSLKVGVKVTDVYGMTFKKLLTINVTDINEAPTNITMNGSILFADANTGTTIGTLSATDPDTGSIVSYSLPSGLGNNASFSLVSNHLVSNATLPIGTYSVVVRASDNGTPALTFDKTFTINVVPAVPVPATDILLSASTISENASLGSVIGTFSAVDANSNDTFVYSLDSSVPGAVDNSFVTIFANQLIVGGSINFEAPKTSLKVGVKVTDSSGQVYSKLLTISVVDVNEAPTGVNLSSVYYSGVPANGTVLSTLSGIDPDAGSTFTYSLVSGTGSTDNSMFSIVGSNLVANSSLTVGSKSLRVRVSDSSGLIYEKVVTFTVTPNGFVPVYRFFRGSNGSHFYTASLAERDNVIAQLSWLYSYEGIRFYVKPVTNGTCPSGSEPLFRFFRGSNGSHFYTASVAEKNNVIANLSGIYTYEGPRMCISNTTTSEFNAPVYRFFRGSNGTHFYTASLAERDNVIAQLSWLYSYEGIRFYVFS